MTKANARDAIDRKRVFDADIIEVAHTTVLRWVTRYVPEFEKRWRRFSKAVGTSWRVDEPYMSIKAKWHYLYRAVDKHGKTVDFLLRRDRGIAAARTFSRNALASTLARVPRKVTLDGHEAGRATRVLCVETTCHDRRRRRSATLAVFEVNSRRSS